MIEIMENHNDMAKKVYQVLHTSFMEIQLKFTSLQIWPVN